MLQFNFFPCNNIQHSLPLENDFPFLSTRPVANLINILRSYYTTESCTYFLHITTRKLVRFDCTTFKRSDTGVFLFRCSSLYKLLNCLFVLKCQSMVSLLIFKFFDLTASFSYLPSLIDGRRPVANQSYHNI